MGFPCFLVSINYHVCLFFYTGPLLCVSCPSISLSLSLSTLVFFYVSLSLCLFFFLSYSLSLSVLLSLSLSPFIFLPFFLSLPLSLSIYSSLSHSLCVCPSLSLSLSLPLSTFPYWTASSPPLFLLPAAKSRNSVSFYPFLHSLPLSICKQSVKSIPFSFHFVSCVRSKLLRDFSQL